MDLQNKCDSAVVYKNGVIRYIVPFYVKKSSDEVTAYEYIRSCFDEKEAWMRYTENHSEIDLFDHIAEWMNPREDGSEIGCSWEYEPFSKSGNKGMKIGWVCKDQSVMRLLVSRMGITVFVTGIGFLWYEVCLGNNKRLERADFSELLEFSSSFKELAQDNERILDLSVPYIPVEECDFDDLRAEGVSVQTEVKGETKKYRFDSQKLLEHAILNTYHLSETQKEKIFAARYRLLPAEPTDPKAKKKKLWKLVLRQDGLGKWIRGLLLDVCGEVRFFENKVRHENGEEIKVPDKALIFGYVAADITEEKQLNEAVCCLAKGYSERYHFSGRALGDVLQLFDHAGCFIGREGCAYVLGAQAADFLRGDFLTRFLTTYFRLYMLLLQQFYGILNFSRRTAEEMPSNPGVYFRKDDQVDYVQRMNQLLLEMNSFLVKNQFSSVSNVQHINDFYQYGYRQMDIKESVESLFGGLQALTEMQLSHRAAEQDREEKRREREAQARYEKQRKLEKLKEKKEAEIRKEDERREKEANDKIEGAMRRLSALAIVSALCDGIGFVTGMSDGWRKVFGAGGWWSLPEFIISLALCYAVIKVGRQALMPIIDEEKQQLRKWIEQQKEKTKKRK